MDFDVNNALLFEGNMQAERIATNIFDNDFNACMGKQWMSWRNISNLIPYSNPSKGRYA